MWKNNTFTSLYKLINRLYTIFRNIFIYIIKTNNEHLFIFQYFCRSLVLIICKLRYSKSCHSVFADIKVFQIFYIIINTLLVFQFLF